MINIILLILLTALAIVFSKTIKKYNILFYILSVLLGSFAIIAPNTAYLKPLVDEFVSFNIFVIVMYIGVLNPKSSYSKKLRLIRTELSIIGFILIMPHGILNLLRRWDLMLIFGVIAYVLMVPLFITSFDAMKKELTLKQWNKLHKLAYIAYLVMFLHVIFVFNVGHPVIYGLLLVVYVVMKVMKTRKVMK